MNLLNRIHKKSVLVVGDVMLDTYYFGEVKRISPEAPVPVFRKRGQKSVPGGAANVAANLAAAEQAVSLLAAVGNDPAGKTLCKHLEDMSIETEMLRPCMVCTTEKTRIIAENNQQVMRLDNEVTDGIGPGDQQALLRQLENAVARFDILVLSDYNKGLLSEEFTRQVIQCAKAHGVRVLVDVKGKNAAKYSGAFLIKPNLSELQMMTELPVKTTEEIVAASETLRKVCAADYVLTTCGPRGMVLVGGKSPVLVPADDHEVFDVTGAGDTALAYLAAALANGFDVKNAVEVANHAAGLQVTKSGTTAIGLHEVSRAVSDALPDTEKKMLDGAAAAKLRALAPGKTIVFTNGCFDILHVGHIRYLREAARQGDILVVGLNSDRSVRELKGSGRPVIRQADRAEMLCALEFVDYVVIFDESTPYELIKCIRPDVLVKGADYKPEEVVGRDIVEANGGKLVLVDYVAGKSTTGIIDRVQEMRRQSI